ncbi:MAG: YlbF family regulator [Peptococcaceae bacterium]|nr:YlbF family regulator [Peptococcaceae bacterium]
MDYLEKARDLGACLASSDEFLQLKAAEEEIKKDQAAWDAFQEFQLKEQALTAGKLFGKISSEKESIAHVDHKVRIMNRYPAVRSYFKLLQAFEKLIATANLAITTSLYGLPSADDLPLPDSLKGLAQQVLDQIGDGADLGSMKIPENFKLPFDLK